VVPVQARGLLDGDVNAEGEHLPAANKSVKHFVVGAQGWDVKPMEVNVGRVWAAHWKHIGA
jgi:hypothetical protein